MSNQSVTLSTGELLNVNANFPVDGSRIKFDITSDIGNTLLKALDESSFEEDYSPSAGSVLQYNPSIQGGEYNGMWRPRAKLLPMNFSRQMVDNNDLLRAIVQQLGFKVSTFCKPQVHHTEPVTKW